ncbi:MAG: hypothetical protein ACAI44_09310 [Candidatus Sericytochromatia bacterium]
MAARHWRKRLLIAAAGVLVALSGASAADIYHLSGNNPELEMVSAFRDLNFARDEFTVDGSQSVAQPNDENCCVFSPDGRWLWVQTKKIAAAKSGGGVMAHVSKIDTLSGKTLSDIPIDLRWPKNPLTPIFTKQGLKADTADRLATSDKRLALLVRAGYAPMRWVPVLYDAASGKLSKILPKITGSANSSPLSLLFSDDGRYLIFEHTAPHRLNIIGTASGTTRQLNLAGMLGQAGLESVSSALYPLPGGQLAFFARRHDDPNEQRIVVLDLDAGSITAVLGEKLDMDINIASEGGFGFKGQALFGPARSRGDDDDASRCGGGGPCLRLYKFPELKEMVRFKVKSEEGSPLLEYVNGANQRMALSEYDSRLLIVGSNTDAKVDYALLLDTTETGEIHDWVKLPVRHNAWFRIGPRREGGYWVLGEQPQPGVGLRLFKF